MFRNVRDLGVFIGILIYLVSVAGFIKIVSRAEADESHEPHVPRG